MVDSNTHSIIEQSFAPCQYPLFNQDQIVYFPSLLPSPIKYSPVTSGVSLVRHAASHTAQGRGRAGAYDSGR